jgi:hypothetical protein
MPGWLGQNRRYVNPKTPAQLRAALVPVHVPDAADAVSAASTFGTDEKVLVSDGTGRGVKASVVSLAAGVFTGVVDIAGGLVINEGAADVDFRVEGDSLSHLIYADASAATENVALIAAAAPNWQSMDRGLFIGDTTTAPTGNPAAGVFVWSESGELKARDGSGNVVTLTNTSAGGTAYDVQVLAANGTWNKPANAVSVYVLCVGGGGGGGSGRRGATSSIRCGGAGGGGGGASRDLFDEGDLASSVSVTVGTGGSGAAAVTINSTDGAAGGNGSSTSFGSHVTAGGGGGGAAGTNNVNAFSQAGAGGTGGYPGGIGGYGVAVDALLLTFRWQPPNSLSAGGGGAGGSLTATNQFYNSGSGGTSSYIGRVMSLGGVGGGSGTPTSEGGAAGMSPDGEPIQIGGGGGGGGAMTTANCLPGGNGGNYGAGGGGGGASLNGFSSGAGGNGAGGLCVVITELA